MKAIIVCLDSLPRRVQNILAARGISSISELADQHTQQPCRVWRGIGRRSAAQIDQLLQEAGLLEGIAEKRRQNLERLRQDLEQLDWDDEQPNRVAGCA